MNYFKMHIYFYILIFILGISLLTMSDLKKECAYYGFPDYKISIYLEKYCLLEINRTKITIPLEDLYNKIIKDTENINIFSPIDMDLYKEGIKKYILKLVNK